MNRITCAAAFLCAKEEVHHWLDGREVTIYERYCASAVWCNDQENNTCSSYLTKIHGVPKPKSCELQCCKFDYCNSVVPLKESQLYLVAFIAIAFFVNIVFWEFRETLRVKTAQRVHTWTLQFWRHLLILVRAMVVTPETHFLLSLLALQTVTYKQTIPNRVLKCDVIILQTFPFEPLNFIMQYTRLL